jgi:hypothetical protein
MKSYLHVLSRKRNNSERACGSRLARLRTPDSGAARGAAAGRGGAAGHQPLVSCARPSRRVVRSRARARPRSRASVKIMKYESRQRSHTDTRHTPRRCKTHCTLRVSQHARWRVSRLETEAQSSRAEQSEHVVVLSFFASIASPRTCFRRREIKHQSCFSIDRVPSVHQPPWLTASRCRPN